MLRQIGISDSEFATPEKNTAVHLYDNQKPGTESLPGQLPITACFRSVAACPLSVFLTFRNHLFRKTVDVKVRANLVSFLRRGGRLYATDWSYDFVQQLPELSPFLCFEDDKDCSVTTPHGFHSAVARGGTGDPILADVSASAGGLRDFLSRLPKPVPSTNIPIGDLLPGWVMIAQTAQDPLRFPTTQYIQGESLGKLRPLTATFDYPPQAGCGRVLYSSYHTRQRQGTRPFPTYCPLGAMLPQEYVLEYLLFELADCLGAAG
ncbi:MAG: hypothetical protein U0787_21260 [Polyangia bacterium]